MKSHSSSLNLQLDTRLLILIRVSKNDDTFEDSTVIFLDLYLQKYLFFIDQGLNVKNFYNWKVVAELSCFMKNVIQFILLALR